MRSRFVSAGIALVVLSLTPGELVAHEGHAVTRHKLDARIAATPTEYARGSTMVAAAAKGGVA